MYVWQLAGTKLKAVAFYLPPQVWPYLLEVYPRGCSDEEKTTHEQKGRHRYQELRSSWQKIESVHSQLRDLLERRSAELAREHTDGGCADNNPLNGFESMYGTTVCVRHSEGGEQASESQPTHGVASGRDSRNGFTIGRTGSPGNSISSGGASPLKSPSHNNNMAEDDEEKTMNVHVGQISKDDATITIELTQECNGKDQCREEQQFAADVSVIMAQLPEELQGVLRTEDGQDWNYRKFFEVTSPWPPVCLDAACHCVAMPVCSDRFLFVCAVASGAVPLHAAVEH